MRTRFLARLPPPGARVCHLFQRSQFGWQIGAGENLGQHAAHFSRIATLGSIRFGRIPLAGAC